MKDHRTSFDEVIATFREFLQSQGWSDDILWLTRERITGHRSTYWVLRPEELAPDTVTRRYYESIRQSPSSIRIDSLAQVKGKSLCYVQNWGGDSRFLNFGTWQGPLKLRVVRSRVLWIMIVVLNRLRGESPFLNEIKMTTIAEPRAGACVH